jgi:hypothetical protein
MAGTAVFKIVVSSDSIKNATATSQGKRRLLEAEGKEEGVGTLVEVVEGIGFLSSNCFFKLSGNLPGWENFRCL